MPAQVHDGRRGQWLNSLRCIGQGRAAVLGGCVTHHDTAAGGEGGVAAEDCAAQGDHHEPQRAQAAAKACCKDIPAGAAGSSRLMPAHACSRRGQLRREALVGWDPGCLSFGGGGRGAHRWNCMHGAVLLFWRWGLAQHCVASWRVCVGASTRWLCPAQLRTRRSGTPRCRRQQRRARSGCSTGLGCCSRSTKTACIGGFGFGGPHAWARCQQHVTHEAWRSSHPTPGACSVAGAGAIQWGQVIHLPEQQAEGEAAAYHECSTDGCNDGHGASHGCIACLLQHTRPAHAAGNAGDVRAALRQRTWVGSTPTSHVGSSGAASSAAAHKAPPALTSVMWAAASYPTMAHWDPSSPKRNVKAGLLMPCSQGGGEQAPCRTVAAGNTSARGSIAEQGSAAEHAPIARPQGQWHAAGGPHRHRAAAASSP